MSQMSQQTEETQQPLVEKIFETCGYPNLQVSGQFSLWQENSDEIILYYPDNVEDQDFALIKSYSTTVFKYTQENHPGIKFRQKKIPYEEFSRRFGEFSRKIAEDSSGIQTTIMNYINRATELGASDVHFDACMTSGNIKARVSGDLMNLGVVAINEIRLMFSIIYNTMCRVDESMYQADKQQNAMFKNEFLNKKLTGVRVASTPSVGGGAMVLRLLYIENIELNKDIRILKQLGYRDLHQSIFDLFIMRPSGVIIVAGPTGSGKSTTLKYIMCELAEDTTVQIITVEDPPEYPIPKARQIPVCSAGTGDERNEAMAATIRSVLRQDPDKIMIGEIRDCESARLALQSAQTGHQVWTTLHANSTFAIIGRLADLLQEKMSERAAMRMLVDPDLVNGLLFQRLVPTLCPHCRIQVTEKVFASLPENLQFRIVDSYLRKIIDIYGRDALERETSEGLTEKFLRRKAYEYLLGKIYLRNQEGCEHCDHGKKSRQVIAEVIHTNAGILEDIARLSVSVAYRKWKFENPDSTIHAHARELILAGELDPRDAERTIGDLNGDIVDSREYQKEK